MAKYDYYVVDKVTGLVHAGNEFREDADDARRDMIDDGVPASRVAVMTAAGVRRKFGRITWGKGRPDVRPAASNGKAKTTPRWATNTKTVQCDECHGTCYPGEAYDSLANVKPRMPFPSWRCLDGRQCEADARRRRARR